MPKKTEEEGGERHGAAKVGVFNARGELVRTYDKSMEHEGMPDFVKGAEGFAAKQTKKTGSEHKVQPLD